MKLRLILLFNLTRSHINILTILSLLIKRFFYYYIKIESNSLRFYLTFFFEKLR